MATDLLIRQATLDDADTIARFNVAMASETEDKPLDLEVVTRGVHGLFKRPEAGRYVVAIDATDNIVGQLMLTYEWSDWRDGMFWWIQSVYVTPARRRTGVYRALYQHVLDTAHEVGEVCGIRLYVEVDNQPAKATYESLGMNKCHYDMYEVGL